jgi:hypothetical protein
MELTKTADVVTSSVILIGNHLTNLVNMVWLIPNSLAVIDLSPQHLSCNRWAERLAAQNNLTYFEVIPHLETCPCATFECYPQGIGDNQDVDVEALKEKIHNAVQFVEQLPVEPTASPEPIPTFRHPKAPELPIGL